MSESSAFKLNQNFVDFCYPNIPGEKVNLIPFVLSSGDNMRSLSANIRNISNGRTNMRIRRDHSIVKAASDSKHHFPVENYLTFWKNINYF